MLNCVKNEKSFISSGPGAADDSAVLTEMVVIISDRVHEISPELL